MQLIATLGNWSDWLELDVRRTPKELLDTNITIELVTMEQIQLLNTIMSSSFKWEINMSVRIQRTCCEEHCGDGVSDGSAFLD